MLLPVWAGLAHGQTAGPTAESLGTMTAPGLPSGGLTGQPDQAGATGAKTESSGKRAWSIVPRIGVQETITDNATLGFGEKKSDQITDISPGVRIEANTARLKMHVDYSLHDLYYAQGSRGNTTQNWLNAFGTLEAVENRLFVDMSGVIARQAISAFGAPSAGSYSVNANSTETSNFRLSPYLRGRLGSLADYDLRYARSMLRTRTSTSYDTDVDELMGRINGDTPLSALGWSFDASRQRYDYSAGRTSESDRWRAFLTYRFDPTLKFSFSGGRERNDFSSLSKQNWNTNGYGLDWIPSERTQVSAFREKRFFGSGHQVTLTHRFPLSTITYRDSRDVSALPYQMTMVGLGNIYDQLFAQLESSIPDPTARATYVNALLSAAGMSPDTQVVPGFLSSQVTVQRRQELSALLRGVRNMVTVGYVRSQNDRLGLGIGTDFSTYSSIVQKGVNLGWSHQLSPLTALNITAFRMRNNGIGIGVNQDSTQKTLSAALSTKFSARTTGSLTARHTKWDSTINPYSENAVIGNVAVQF